jgi:2-enoate reductase
MRMFEKMNIGTMTVKNRIVMAPMGTLSDGDGGFSERIIRYYVERAKGGVGMIITGFNQCTDKYEDYYCSLLDSHHHVGRLGILVEQVHRYGAKLCVQIGPGMGRLATVNRYTTAYSASETSSYWRPDVKCKSFNINDIKFIINKVGYSANLAKRAGADAVEIHAYGGYLLDQFMSKLWNHRTDEYGGDLQGRMKFLLEIIQTVRKFCGKDFPIIVKFTAQHNIPGGRDISEGIEIAKILEEAGVDALQVDKGFYDCWYEVIPTVYQEEGCKLDVVAEIKKHVNIPILAQGKLSSPFFIERILEEKKADFILLGRQLLADPHWVNKVKNGRTNDIVPCIGCSECLHSGLKGKYYTCSVNPLCQHEDDYRFSKSAEKKSVLVIGGGPGGMQAAITAAERGFNVQLWERNDRLGGLLLAAGVPTFKKDIVKYVNYLIGKLNRSQVDIKLNKEATPEEIIAGSFDSVIIATGATPRLPAISGIEKEKVKTAPDVLLGVSKVNGKVVIIGGGLVGCETALHCLKLAKQVTIVEALDDILTTSDQCRNNDQKLRAMLREAHINIITKARVTSIGDDNIICEQDGKEFSISCDTAVIATGYKPNNELAQALEEKGLNVSVIGDAVKPGKIFSAVHGGFSAISLM